MSKRTFIGVLVVGLAVALTAGGLLASNMGFKLNKGLIQAGGVVPGGSSKSGTTTIALPYNRQSGLSTANGLVADITLARISNVQRFLESSDGLQTYTGRVLSPSPDFALADGEGYFVRMRTTTNYIAVGSHNPTLAVVLNQSGSAVPGGTSKSGTNFFSYPYHSTRGTANDLLADIGLASVTNVQRFLESSDGLQTYTGRVLSPSPNFNLAPGETYFIRMRTTVNFTPSHY